MREAFLEFIDKIKFLFSQVFDGHPFRLYMLGIGVLIFYQIGLILDWDWTVQRPTTGKGFWLNFIFENYSRKTYRIVLSIANIVLIVSLSGLYYIKYIK